MNEIIKNKILSARFEKDASQGFELVHGSEEFFKNIKSPFEAPGAKLAKGTWQFIALEIVIAVGLIVAGNYMNVEPQTGAETVMPFPVLVMPEKGPQPEVKTEPVVIATLHQKSSYSKQQVLDKLTDPNPIVKTDTVHITEISQPLVTITKPDSLNIYDPGFTYIYQNNQSKYRMCYVEDLLIVNYSDTAKKAKLDPYLSGTEARWESKNDRMALEPVQPFKLVENTDYLIRITRPLKFMKEKKYKDALKSFRNMIKENAADQNALFYGALCYIELGNHSKALVFLNKLKETENPVFTEDADWMLAKVYREMGMESSAKGMLKTIAHSNSYYRAQAVQELKK
ncbi:MAG TPA: tetratricopeptide repeat protein [Flavobacteriales bacterium]|nr:tetratricopeptide repeat protein [Flavobacteriales bacterium]